MKPGESFYATVVKKVRSTDDEAWYVLQTDVPDLPMALMKFKEYGENFYDFNVYVHLRKIENVPESPITVKNYAFVGFVLISPVIEEKQGL